MDQREKIIRAFRQKWHHRWGETYIRRLLRIDIKELRALRS